MKSNTFEDRNSWTKPKRSRKRQISNLKSVAELQYDPHAYRAKLKRSNLSSKLKNGRLANPKIFNNYMDRVEEKTFRTEFETTSMKEIKRIHNFLQNIQNSEAIEDVVDSDRRIYIQSPFVTELEGGSIKKHKVGCLLAPQSTLISIALSFRSFIKRIT